MLMHLIGWTTIDDDRGGTDVRFPAARGGHVERYGRRVVADLPFETAVDETIHALRAEGFDLAGRMDVRRFLVHTLHHDFRRYVLLEVVSPEVTLEALRQDLDVGAVLPTTCAIFELADGETAVVVAEPFGGLGSDAEWRRTAPALAVLADQACEQIARALNRLQQAARRRAHPDAA
jgi:uncharacterized protein (DUF302 family)